GSCTAPTAAGSYAVTGTVNEANWQGSATGTLVVGKGTATVTLEYLAQTYDGAAKSATATTVPAGLTVDFTYDGSGTAPTAAGSYAVTGTVNEANWQGSATGTHVVGKGTATVTLGDLAQTYDGTAKSATATTVPAGLAVDFTYDGSGTAPTAAGSYAVTGTVNEANWQGSAAGTLVVGKGTATVTLLDLAQTYDGAAKNATATTVPAGLVVDLTYDGSGTAPTAAGSYAVTGTVNEANWQGTNVGTLVVGKGNATVTLGSLAHTYDGTPKSATATTVPAGLAVDFTYDGSATAPTAVGSYAVTGTVNEANWQGSAAGALTIDKSSQTITDFLPADGAIFARGAVTTLTAQASSGLAVGFTNLTPEIADLAGAAITFTNYGVARVQAFQAGDANWAAAAPVTREYRVGAILTNVAPGRANVGGGLAVTIQGLWIGNGADVASVTLAGVPATIVTQGFHAVTVRPGLAAAAATGDVVVTSASAGTLVLSNAFEYLWLDAPVQLDPVDVTASNLVARWLTVPAAATHVLEVGLDTNFTANLPGYEAVDVAFAQQYPVEGLSAGTWYALRIFARDANGLGRPSRTVWVPAGTQTPYETHPPLSGPVSQGATMQRALANMFNGTGLVYAAESSDTNVAGVAIASGQLVLTPRNPGTATITVRATDPATGYATSYSFDVQVVGAPVLASADFLPREIWNPRFTQALQIRNDEGADAIGVRLLFSNLMPGISVEIRTGTAADGRPMIEMETPFAAGATLDLNVVYLCAGAYTVDLYPPTIELQFVLPEWRPPLPDGGVEILGLPLSGGRYVLEFESIVGLLYAIEYMNDFPAGSWNEVPLRLRATANRTQWIDAGPPATQPPSGLRVYRVKELAE
ncbi:MAG: MBG domain-containing protein, partial [Solirubrobacteraceae bacterium]